MKGLSGNVDNADLDACPGHVDFAQDRVITPVCMWIIGMAGVYAVEHLVEKVKAEREYLADTEVIFMRTANPDGFLYSTTTGLLPMARCILCGFYRVDLPCCVHV